MTVEFYEDYERIIRCACPGYDSCLDLISRNIPEGVSYILDLGSGTGNLAMTIHKHHPDISIFGIEKQKSLVEAARAKVDSENVIFCDEDILDFDWPPAQCVVSSLVIHHFSHEQKRKIFETIYERSKFFIYFDRIKGRNETEERQNMKCLIDFMRKSGLSEEIIREGRKDMEKNDKPLTAEELENMLREIGFDFKVLYQKFCFAIYYCVRKE